MFFYYFEYIKVDLISKKTEYCIERRNFYNLEDCKKRLQNHLKKYKSPSIEYMCIKINKCYHTGNQIVYRKLEFIEYQLDSDGKLLIEIGTRIC